MSISSTTSSQPNETLSENGNNKSTILSINHIIGISVGVSLFIIILLIFLALYIYRRHKMTYKKNHAHSMNSNNPCYVSGPVNEFEPTNNNHAHCNMSVLTDFYDIDDLNSLDNDSFLNSLENAIFVGYLNHNRPSYSIDHSLSRMSSESTVASNQPICIKNEQRNRKTSNNNCNTNNGNSNSSKFSTGQNNVRSSIQLRSKKSKRSTSAIDSNTDHIRPHNTSETGCEITRSTSNLISSKMCLTASADSVCNSSRGSNQLPEVANHYKSETQASRDAPGDNKTESSNDSRTSVNSSSAMMSSYLAENNPPSQTLPDLINSSLPKSTKRHKRVSSAYSNIVSRDDYIFSTTARSGQILDPLRAGQTFHFTNENPDSSVQPKHDHQLSHNFGISNVGVFDYNISS